MLRKSTSLLRKSTSLLRSAPTRRPCLFFASWIVFVNWAVFLFHVDLALSYSNGYGASGNATVHPKKK